MVRLLAAVLSLKKPLFHSVQTNWPIQTRVLPNRNYITLVFLARFFLPMPPPKHVQFWEGPTPEERTPRVSGELRGAGPPCTGRENGADSAPLPEEHPLTSPRMFVSSRHKADSNVPTGLQSGQAIVKEGGERPVTKVYLPICYAGNLGGLVDTLASTTPVAPGVKIPTWSRY